MVFLIAGSPGLDLVFIKQCLATVKPQAILCADGGALSLWELGWVPAAVIGDMDSLPAEILQELARRGTRIVRHSAHKDETDTWLALQEAFQLDPDEVWIFGALGGRIDHTLANLSLLGQGLERGVTVRLVDPTCRIFLAKGKSVLEGNTGDLVSLFPFSGSARGITLEGFAYPLTNAEMTVGYPYGVSNVLTSPTGIIAVDEGCLLVVHSAAIHCGRGGY